MEWNFTLNGTEIEEPIGFNDITFNVQRDEKWHGMFFEASTTQLGFYSTAYDILKEAKETQGFDAEVIFAASQRCEGQTDFDEVLSGKLSFADYQETCGTECIIRMRIEQS